MALVPLKRMPEIAWSLTNTTFGIWRRSSSFCMYQQRRQWRFLRRASSSDARQVVPHEVCVEYGAGGLPCLTVPLPSRRERCRFTLRPVTDTVDTLLADLRREDKGIDRAAVHHTDGTRLASSTRISSLLGADFRLVINDVVYHVSPPALECVGADEEASLGSVRARVSQLYAALHVDQHRRDAEDRLMGRREEIRGELEPLEKKRDELLAGARRRSSALSWLGLALMGAQFGVLARLTWWEYSWDIMEPVTYFITYGTTLAMYAYFVLTRQEYVLPDVYDRQTLLGFHKGAGKHGLDVRRYNELRDALARVDEDLRRLRDPLHLHLPLRDPAPAPPSAER